LSVVFRITFFDATAFTIIPIAALKKMTNTEFTLKKLIAANEQKNSRNEMIPVMFFFPKSNIAFVKSAATDTFIPARAFFTKGLCAKFWTNDAIMEIIIREGVTIPAVAAMLPSMPDLV
jgi:hypothetical protein